MRRRDLRLAPRSLGRRPSKEIVMIEFELLRDAGVLIVAPKEALTAEDFRAISSTVDPYIGENGKLTGLLLEAPSFPGWDSLGAVIEHMSFVRDHHRKIERVAVVTDSTILTMAPKIAAHFARPEFKVFRSGESQTATARASGRRPLGRGDVSAQKHIQTPSDAADVQHAGRAQRRPWRRACMFRARALSCRFCGPQR